MRSLLLVVCLSGLTLAEDPPFVRITHPADAAALTPDADFEVRGVFDHQSVGDASKYEVQLRMYQGVANRLNLVHKATVELVKVDGDAGLYNFRAKLHQPAGGADCILRVEVFQTVPDGQKQMARDLVVTHAGQPGALGRADADEGSADRSAQDRRVVNLHHPGDGARYAEGSNICPFGSIPLVDKSISLKWQARLRLYRVIDGKLKVFEEAMEVLEPDDRLEQLRFSHTFQPKQRRPGGAYVMRIDVIDREKPEQSKLWDALLLEVVRMPRKPPPSS